jgi:hypothetical protein
LSDLKVDGIIASTGTNTALTLQGKGSGKVAIGDGALLFPDADGSDGQFIKTDGSAALSFAAAGGAWNLIGTSVASASASLTITGLDSTYDTYAIQLSDLNPATDSVAAELRTGAGSIDTGSNYHYATQQMNDAGTERLLSANAADSMLMTTTNSVFNCGNATEEGFGGLIFLHRPLDGTMNPTFSGVVTSVTEGATLCRGDFAGMHTTAVDVDRVLFQFSSGNIDTGRMTVWGVAHA